MRVLISALLTFAATGMAYRVLTPGLSTNWTDEGQQLLTWERVNTDRLNFTAVLVNQDTSIMQSPQVLAALIDGTLGNATVNPPSGGWPVGDGFQVNLCQDADNLNSILAQSSKFSITIPTTSGAPSSTRRPSGTTQIQPPPTTAGVTGSDSTVDPSAVPPGSGGAISTKAQAGVVGLVALMGLFLA